MSHAKTSIKCEWKEMVGTDCFEEFCIKVYTLKKKFKEWEQWLSGEDSHSIRNQLYNIIWDSAVFQVINESRKHAAKDEEGKPKLNEMVHGFINTGFFQTQTVAIRRLLDKNTTEGKRSVISLRRLIDNMEEHIDLLTRSNILAALGYPYDYEKIRLNRTTIIQSKKDDDQILKATFSEHMHEYIDELSGVNPSKRKPEDEVRPEIFKWLKDRLIPCDEICKYVNQFLAHSATPESRKFTKSNQIKITFGKILKSHKILCETASFIGLRFLYHNLGNVLLTPLFNQFEYFEEPWSNGETLCKLAGTWKQYEKETEKWVDWDWKSEFENSNS